MNQFNKLSHVIWQCKYHIVWCPKYRFRILEGAPLVWMKKKSKNMSNGTLTLSGVVIDKTCPFNIIKAIANQL